MEERIDPYTGESFIPKRSNQKYANEGNRIKNNNQKAKKLKEEKNEKNKILDKNLKIYKRILQNSNSEKKSKDYMEGAEFNSDIHTHIYENEGRTFFMTYDFGFTILDDGGILLKNFKISVK